MKKFKKLVIHSIVIVVLLFVFYYFGGYYISKEECIRDILRSHYAKETNILMEIGNGKHSVTVVTDEKNQSCFFVGTKKIGFLYRAESSSTSRKISTREKLDFSVFANNSMGAIIFLYRNDTSIDRVEVIMTDGTSIILDEWNDNFTGYHTNFDKWRSNTYKAYNASNQLIYEKEY